MGDRITPTKDNKMKNTYTVRAKIVSVIGSKFGGYNIVFQRIDTIEDENNPFCGQRKLAVKRFENHVLADLCKLWNLPRISKLVHKQVILKMRDDGTIFESVLAIAKDNVLGFRTIPQQLPKFVLKESTGVEERGEML